MTLLRDNLVIMATDVVEIRMMKTTILPKVMELIEDTRSTTSIEKCRAPD